jgi:hypothetical protein
VTESVDTSAMDSAREDWDAYDVAVRDRILMALWRAGNDACAVGDGLCDKKFDDLPKEVQTAITNYLYVDESKKDDAYQAMLNAGTAYHDYVNKKYPNMYTNTINYEAKQDNDTEYFRLIDELDKAEKFYDSIRVDESKNVDAFVAWHESADNYQNDPEKFKQIYKIFSDNGIDDDTEVDVAFNKLSASDKHKVMQIAGLEFVDESLSSMGWSIKDYPIGSKITATNVWNDSIISGTVHAVKPDTIYIKTADGAIKQAGSLSYSIDFVNEAIAVGELYVANEVFYAQEGYAVKPVEMSLHDHLITLQEQCYL